MQVKAIKKYSDIVLKKVVAINDVLDVTDDRDKHLIEQGMVEAVENSETPKKAEKKEPAK